MQSTVNFYLSARYKNMNIMLETKATIPNVVNVKNGIESMNKLCKGTSLITILAAIYNQIRKELIQSVKNIALLLLIV